jgi:hypothetical protein
MAPKNPHCRENLKSLMKLSFQHAEKLSIAPLEQYYLSKHNQPQLLG